jgi:large subunit ribosomal protein L29
MKASELRAMPDEQLALTLKEVTKNFFHLRVQSATERLETPSEIKKAKKDIARIKTIQRERQLAAARQQPAAQQGT